ncbi:DUF1748-domain-containing protein [Basidiobolus meristosporus CBS 931.73]|uniref:DUF1748-domain-containing protein n=1 Tax=Basidiobolus meristosporus CBS 931.73 TaxID=1314790 RepID=A0A1Y1XIW0_9FUNG|nr:DUF1748-domain-containing protein [Basidiobolus meristosporus CBS 931.73]|eukprot:ORX85643.1 DUF1748-domain-containing protein [Basidiobolus meristosporus CBS 931.73]
MSGRLLHYAIDAALISTVFAGVKRNTGLTFDLNKIENSTARSAAETYLNFGEYCFDTVVKNMKNTEYTKSKD